MGLFSNILKGVVGEIVKEAVKKPSNNRELPKENFSSTPVENAPAKEMRDKNYFRNILKMYLWY